MYIYIYRARSPWHASKVNRAGGTCVFVAFAPPPNPLPRLYIFAYIFAYSKPPAINQKFIDTHFFTDCCKFKGKEKPFHFPYCRALFCKKSPFAHARINAKNFSVFISQKMVKIFSLNMENQVNKNQQFLTMNGTKKCRN